MTIKVDQDIDAIGPAQIRRRAAGRDGQDMPARSPAAFDDLLAGNTGVNRLDGGSGDDVLTGGQGRDILTGGDGADRFVFLALTDSGTGSATRDRIMDLDIVAGDRIDFSALDIAPSTPAHETLTYIGSTGYSGTAGEVRISTSSSAGYTAVAIDSDGDRTSDFVIEVALPVTSVDASAFLL
ncbi:M10 family metallopeptidase C-terminal domain-containing protein [Tistrella mobilis]